MEPAAATSRINACRVSQGLQPSRLDAALVAMADRQAKVMSAADRMSQDVAGSFGSRLAAGGVDTINGRENLGAG